MNHFFKKISSIILTVVLLTANILPISAADLDIETKMQQATTNQQYFVYQLTNIMLDQELKMHSIIDDDFFDDKTKNALTGVFTFQDTGALLLGTDVFESKYYRGIMAECLLPGIVKNEQTIDWTLVGMEDELLYNEMIEIFEDLETPVPELQNIEFIHESFNITNSLGEASTETGRLLNKIACYSSAHLNALKLVSEYATPETPISGAAKMVIDATNNVEFKDAFENYAKFLYMELIEKSIDFSLAAISSSASEWISNCFEIVAGEEYETEMEELYYLNFQNQIFHTFSKITDKYPNLLKADYTVAEIKNLTDLTLLYLRCGQLGFQTNYPERSAACEAAYRELQQMEFPWTEEGGNTMITEDVQVYDYNVPGTISQGDYYVIFGTVSSNETILNATAEISGTNGYLCATADNINSNYFDIGTLDTQLRFDDLLPGNYHYQVTVSTANGEHEVISSDFQVQAENGEMIITGYKLPHTLNVGDIFSVTGTVKSKTPMTSVTVEIRDGAGNHMTGATASGSYISYNLHDLDYEVEFDKVPSGRYHYIIKASNSYGEEILVDQEYLVK